MNTLSISLAGMVIFTTAIEMRAETVRVSNRSSLVEAIRKASPGTVILIAPGNYRGGLTLDRVAGAPGSPIVLASEDPVRPATFEGGNTGLHLTRIKHVELRDLVFQGNQGNGLNIDDGGQRENPSHHVILRGLRVQDIGPKGNRDGIKLSGVRDFMVENCIVEKWGDAGSAIDMVGCHQGRITECAFQGARGGSANGVQAKGGSSGITIERCVFRKVGGRAVNAGGSTGLDFFRPPTAAYEAKDITIQDCFFQGASAPVAFVGVDGALFQHNTIYRPQPWALRILQENQGSRFVACRNGRFLNNIIVFESSGLRATVNIGPKTKPETFRFEGNAWYCLDRPTQTQRLVRLPTKEVAGTYGVDPKFLDPENEDFRLQESSSVRGKGCTGIDQIQCESIRLSGSKIP